jgi:hypothetical protein
MHWNGNGMGKSNGHVRLAALGFVGGVATGLAVWSSQLHRSRRELFSESVVRRVAALGHLRGRRGSATVRLLGEYVRWERIPLLRRRAELLLRDMAHDLD